MLKILYYNFYPILYLFYLFINYVNNYDYTCNV